MKKEINYPIIVERSLNSLIDYLNENDGNGKKYLILSDDNIPSNYIDELKNCLNEISTDVYTYIIQNGEDSKTLESVKEISEYLILKEFNKKDYIINLGGGVICDLGAFTASIYKRGMKFINLPTSLLADVDASIGSKCAVNLSNVKNALGDFYDPSFVLINPNYLDSLDFRNIRNGLFEVIKTALIKSPNLFEYLYNLTDINNIDFEYIISECVKIKSSIVNEDYYDESVRHVLNFGHTLGHVIEKANIGYLHGESVALGMLCFIEDNTLRNKVLELYKHLDFEISSNFDYKQYVELIRNDKKCFSENGELYINVIIVSKLGNAEIKKMKL